MLDSTAFSNHGQLANLTTQPAALQPKSSLDFSAGKSDCMGSGGDTIAFIDAALPDYQKLAAGVKPGTEVHVLDPRSNEIEQIDQILAGRTNISSLAIYSHGNAGSLQLGNQNLNRDNLSAYSSDLQAWSKSLSQGADLLFYGCNVAAGNEGKAFVQQIDQLTGADVAASKDITGSAAVGGNWNLEYHTGSIETSGPLQAATEASYNHALKTFTVTNTNGTGAGSLLQAVNDSNATAGTDTINFSLSGPQTIKLAFGQFGQLELTDSVNIVGPGAANLTISGEHQSRVFQVDVGKTVQISGLTIANGGEISKVDKGGGILNKGGNLTVTNCTFKDNHVTNDGGAIANGGTLTVKNSTFSNNIAGGLGRPGQGSGSGIDGRGGAIFNSGTTATVTNSTFSNNKAGVEGGGIMNSFGTVTVTGSTFSNNLANRDGGGIMNGGVLVGNSKSFLNVNSSTFTGNQATAIASGPGGLGGAIANFAGATLTLTDSTVQQNTAQNSGGGVFNENGSIAKVKHSTIKLNKALNLAALGIDVRGTFQSLGSNVIGKGAGSTGFVNGVNGDVVG